MTEPLPPEQPDPGDTIPDVPNDPVPEPDVEPGASGIVLVAK